MHNLSIYITFKFFLYIQTFYIEKKITIPEVKCYHEKNISLSSLFES